MLFAMLNIMMSVLYVGGVSGVCCLKWWCQGINIGHCGDVNYYWVLLVVPVNKLTTHCRAQHKLGKQMSKTSLRNTIQLKATQHCYSVLFVLAVLKSLTIRSASHNKLT